MKRAKAKLIFREINKFVSDIPKQNDKSYNKL